MLTTLLIISSFMQFTQPAEVTAYCSCERCCGEHADGITASGYKLQAGDLIVAAPRSIPFGTKVFIPGYGLATVEDIGGAIQGNRLDVWFPTHEEALKWGRQNLEVLQWNVK